MVKRHTVPSTLPETNHAAHMLIFALLFFDAGGSVFYVMDFWNSTTGATPQLLHSFLCNLRIKSRPELAVF